jgi:membrane-associated phospholipid phosphatase
VTVRGHKALLVVETLALLAPLTLVMLLMLTLQYAAYPIPHHPLQLAFDLGLLIEVVAIVGAWRIVAIYLHAGRDALRNTSLVWLRLVATGAFIGLLGTAIALEHAANPESARTYVGFALLSPGFLLIPMYLHLRYERRA